MEQTPETTESLDNLDAYDFAPGCQMWRCEQAPNPATHVMEARVPHCGDHAAYLICTACVQHFWAVKTAHRVECEKHPGVVYFWPQIVTIRPLVNP